MTQPSEAIERFFRAFERSSDRGDIPALLPQFADTFMVAGGQGAQCVRSSDFALVLPKRKQFFDSLRCQSTTLVLLEENRLNERFVLANTRWRMTFACADGAMKDALADSLFIVDTAVEGFKIVFYLPRQDHMTMLREQGILQD